MELICEFKYDSVGVFYTCYIICQKVPKSGELKFVGKHILGHSNDNVIDVIFYKCDVKKIPQGLTKFFPNMEDLSILNSNLENITKSDLAEYKHLNRFCFCDNNIETLPGDLFKDFKDLHEIAFTCNELKLIEPNILDGLFNLRFVNFRGNPNYTKSYSIGVFEGNASLEEVKTELLQKFCSDPNNVKNMFQKHTEEIEKLEKTISEMSHEIQELKRSLKDLKGEKIEKSNLKLNFENGIKDEIKQLLSDESFKDFTIVIGDQEFNVHKLLLIARSPTLADILRNNPCVENLNLIDIPVKIFEKVLNFIYTDEYSCEDDTNLLQLFAAAGRLKINKLKENVASKILDQINSENALDVLKLSNKYDHNELREKSFMKIKEMYPKMCFIDEWAFETEQVTNVIELFNKKEEAIRKIEEYFWSKVKRK